MKTHVFISYSRKNISFADALVEHLETQDIPFWIDRHAITHYDHSFEQKIRQALKMSWAAILIATPDSFASSYVQGELDIIREREIPLFILWADGEYFTDTVPTYITRQSYIDARATEQPTAFVKLTASLQQFWSEKVPAIEYMPGDLSMLPLSYTELLLPDGKQLAFLPSRFKTIDAFLNRLYMDFLKDLYLPFTYGQNWVITWGSREIVPAFIDVSHLTDDNRSWQQQSLSDYGLLSGSKYRVISLSDNHVWKIVVSNDSRLARFVEGLKISNSMRVMLIKVLWQIQHDILENKGRPFDQHYINYPAYWVFLTERSDVSEPRLEVVEI